MACVRQVSAMEQAFTKKDLALWVRDDNPGDPLALRHTASADEKLPEPPKPMVDPSKRVSRYRAGQVPQFAAGYEDDRGFVTAHNQVRSSATAKAAAAPSSGRKKVEATILSTAPRSSSSSAVVTSAAKATSRLAKESDEEIDNALSESSSDDDDEQDNRRQILRKKLLQQKKSEPAESAESAPAPTPTAPAKRPLVASVSSRAAPATALSSSSGTSGSEYETDSDDSDDEREQLMKPVFVPKCARATISRDDEIEAEEQRRHQQQLEKQKARKLESKKLVAEEILREQAEANRSKNETDSEMPDDTDGVDPDAEYRAWELREMRRIKRDNDKREKLRREQEETFRRRNLTDEERRLEDEQLQKTQPKEKTKLKFLQRYHHKGAFYQDEDSIKDKNDVRKRDASGATLEDKFNKEMLPKVMQVKNFGRSGRSKYTHLVDQDTSTKDSLWTRRDAIRDKYTSNLSGMRDLDSANAKKRKMN
ncbi:TPA: hypothetical protein N0F65_005980 [Lagenidium giganteum]|uniref:Micro-fibrillar-associated protein 1 C-terminal domain-containing protein n=1 Tax=Lagenidium giganteum TaxID=4803 RepID=A0AAV2Z6C6_9STRA|nr:TPA: hypothetical protein N0F65_005980 [Lagenidium giganteum]